MCDRCKDEVAGTNSQRGKNTEEVRAYYGNDMKAQSATDSYLKSDSVWRLKETNDVDMQIRSPQYTPLLVMMMIELHAFPDRRQYYLYGSLPAAQTEIIELLKRAQIIVPRASPMLPGAVQMWDVEEDALRSYVDAICRISLPEKTWVTR